jgi:hypothetical protein
MIRPSDRDHSETAAYQAATSKRRATALPEKLEKRLKGYALAAGAAGVGVLALAPPAQASNISVQQASNSAGDIIFTPVQLSLGSFTTTYNFYASPKYTRSTMPIDLDHNGTPDVVFNGVRSSTTSFSKETSL